MLHCSKEFAKSDAVVLLKLCFYSISVTCCCCWYHTAHGFEISILCNVVRVTLDTAVTAQYTMYIDVLCSIVMPNWKVGECWDRYPFALQLHQSPYGTVAGICDWGVTIWWRVLRCDIRIFISACFQTNLPIVGLCLEEELFMVFSSLTSRIWYLTKRIRCRHERRSREAI